MFEYGLAQDAFKKACLERTRKGGFGSTAQRKFIFHNKESIEAPSPGQYEVGRAINILIFFFFLFRDTLDWKSLHNHVKMRFFVI